VKFSNQKRADIFINTESDSVRGIIYPSAQELDGKCCVLFFRSEDCCDIFPAWNLALKENRPNVPKFWLGLDPTSLNVLDPLDNSKKK
jgi:hypothetical protein